MNGDEGAVWSSWAARWERFQEAYVPHREDQFRLIREYVALQAGRSGVRVLDLCCGPGSLARRILAGLPAAEVVGADFDPWLLELGRRTAGDLGIRWVETDVRTESWSAGFEPHGFDAVVVATALHWFTPEEVERIYRDAVRLLAEGGVFLSSDLVPAGSPAVKRLAAQALRRRQGAGTSNGSGEDWVSFWQEARRVPRFRELLEERDRRLAPRRPFLARPLELHEAALREAGFAHVGEVWRCHENAVLLAIR